MSARFSQSKLSFIPSNFHHSCSKIIYYKSIYLASCICVISHLILIWYENWVSIFSHVLLMLLYHFSSHFFPPCTQLFNDLIWISCFFGASICCNSKLNAEVHKFRISNLILYFYGIDLQFICVVYFIVIICFMLCFYIS